MHGYFIEQMAMYSAYHRDFRNRLTHFVGVPAIAFALLVPMAWGGLGEVGGYTISVATLFAAAVMVFWILADPPLGIATTLFYLPFLVVADWVGAMDRGTGWIVFAICFVGGWAFQLVGHGFEGRKPALLDNLVQIFVAPVFLMAEVWFAFGLRRQLRAQVAKRAPRYFAPDRDRHGAAAGNR